MKSNENGKINDSLQEAERIEAQANTNAASRAIAVIVLMVLPGIAGSYLDGWLGTQVFVILGFAIGIAISIFGLLYVAKIADAAAKKTRELRENRSTEPPFREERKSETEGEKTHEG